MLIINNKTKLLKTTKINNISNICEFCNLDYQSYNLSYFNKDNKIKSICVYCSMIDNIKYENIDNLILCYSKLEQSEIINKTITYIRNNNKVPQINIIDPKVKNLNISLLEYIDILENFDKANINKVPKKILNNYKIFFSQDFDFESTNNYDFDDSDSDCNNNEDNDNEDNNDCNIKTHKMTDKEINFFNTYYDNIAV